MFGPAIGEAFRAGRTVAPVLDLALMARGFDLGNFRFAPQTLGLVDGQAVGRTVGKSGFRPIEYGSGIEHAKIQAATTSVLVEDKEQQMRRLLESYDPRGSGGTIYWASTDLVPADWDTIFTGILYDWKVKPDSVEFLLKTDDSALRSPVPQDVVERAIWGSSFEPTIFGTQTPLVLGIHDAFLLTARGMVPCQNVRYDDDFGFWWIVSVGNVKIRRVYFDGIVQPTSIWTEQHGVVGGSLLTILSINPSFVPEKGTVVSCDVEGPSPSGQLPASNSLVNPVKILRVVLEEYALRASPLGLWVGPHPLIDDASWTATAAFFDQYEYDCGRRFGADQNVLSAAEVCQSFLDAYPWCRMWWTPLGKLAIGVLNNDDVDPDAAAWVPVDVVSQGGNYEFEPGDVREVYTHVVQPYMESAQEAKFSATYEAHDLAALSEVENGIVVEKKLRLTIENRWSQARFTLD